MTKDNQDMILLETTALIIKMIGTYDQPTGERYQQLCRTIATLLGFCCNFNSIGVAATSAWLDGTFAALKAMILQYVHDEQKAPAEEPTEH